MIAALQNILQFPSLSLIFYFTINFPKYSCYIRKSLVSKEVNIENYGINNILYYRQTFRFKKNDNKSTSTVNKPTAQQLRTI